jgi:hypothetical protein
MAQTNTTLVSWRKLVKQPDNQQFTSGNSYWIEEPGYPSVAVDGLVSGGSVNPTANVNEVSVEAAVIQVAGQLVSVTADPSMTLTRPLAANKVLISAIVVSAGGTLSVVAGTEGTSGGARGAAGGSPFVPVGSLLLAEIVLSTVADAQVLAPEINTIPERIDIPSYSVDLMTGAVNMASPLEAIHTGSVPRDVYAQYKYATMADVGDLFDFNLSMKPKTVDSTAFNEDWDTQKEGTRSWSGSFNGYWVNKAWYSRAAKVDGGCYVLKFFVDRLQTSYWVGRAILDWSVKVSKDAMVQETVNLVGNGPLVFRDS